MQVDAPGVDYRCIKRSSKQCSPSFTRDQPLPGSWCAYHAGWTQFVQLDFELVQAACWTHNPAVRLEPMPPLMRSRRCQPAATRWTQTPLRWRCFRNGVKTHQNHRPTQAVLAHMLATSPMSARNSPRSERAGSKSCTYLHMLSPPHTPQLSKPSGQHTPDGGNKLEQHVPSASTATPVPLHTPHASTRLPRQQAPLLSTPLPRGQHTPDVVSTGPGQHWPSTSTTPESTGIYSHAHTSCRIIRLTRIMSALTCSADYAPPPPPRGIPRPISSIDTATQHAGLQARLTSTRRCCCTHQQPNAASSPRPTLLAHALTRTILLTTHGVGRVAAVCIHAASTHRHH